MTLTKDNIINSIREKLDLSKGRSADLVEFLLETMKRTLENGEDILISGFGKFCIKEKKERTGRTSQTGEGMTSESMKVLTFKCSPVFKNRINAED